MYTKEDLLQGLSGVNPNGALMVHISYKAIGDVEGRGDAVIDVLMDYMKDGLLVLPSHTWGNVRTQNPVMDVLYTPTCIGVLTDLFRKRDGVVRSLHPTHSVAAYGNKALEFVSGEENIKTPCGHGGVYHKLWQMDAQILLIGVDFTRNTFIHGIEEWDGAHGILKEEPESYFVVDYQGQRLHTPQYRHCSRLSSATFSKLEPQAIQQGVLTLGSFGEATTRLMHAKALRDMVAPLIKSNPKYLLGH